MPAILLPSLQRVITLCTIQNFCNKRQCRNITKFETITNPITWNAVCPRMAHTSSLRLTRFGDPVQAREFFTSKGDFSRLNDICIPSPLTDEDIYHILRTKNATPRNMNLRPHFSLGQIPFRQFKVYLNLSDCLAEAVILVSEFSNCSTFI